MYIYLDTSHLQKWQQCTLSFDEISILNKLKNSGKCKFVLSVSHIFDIADRDDIHLAAELGKFIDNLPKKWLCNLEDLEKKELQNAIKYYQTNQIDKIDPFVSDFVETVFCDEKHILQLRLDYRGKSMEKIIQELAGDNSHKTPNGLRKENLQIWADNNHINNAQNKEKDMQINLKRVLREKIIKFKLQEFIANLTIFKSQSFISPIDEFINRIIDNSSLIPSIFCPYYTQNYMLRDKNMKWKKSHVYDLTHLTALPYVDYLSTDKQINSFIKQAGKIAKKYFPASWEKKLITSIKQINL